MKTDDTGWSLGHIKFFLAEKGWGAITVPELPEGTDVWFHHSALDTEWEWLRPGEPVKVRYTAAEQNTFRFKALALRRAPGGDTATGKDVEEAPR